MNATAYAARLYHDAETLSEAADWFRELGRSKEDIRVLLVGAESARRRAQRILNEEQKRRSLSAA
jgi:hypothetical protein